MRPSRIGRARTSGSRHRSTTDAGAVVDRSLSALALVGVVAYLPAAVLVVGAAGLPPWWPTACGLVALAALAALVRCVALARSALVPARVLLGVYASCLVGTTLLLDDGRGDEGIRWLIGLSYIAVALVPVAFSGGTSLVVGLVGLAGYAGLRLTPPWESVRALVVDDITFLAATLVTATAGLHVIREAVAREVRARELAVTGRQVADSDLRLSRVSAEFAAMVHDDVLAVLSAARMVGTDAPPELAAGARRALSRLSSPGPVRVEGDLATRIAHVARRHEDLVVVLRVADPAVRRLPTEVADAFVDATAEALRNAARHAYPGSSGPGEVRVVMGPVEHVAGPSVRVEIVDDGIGFDDRTVRADRFGLTVSVRRRMGAVGGTGRWSARPGAGTTVVLEWRGAR